MTIKKLYLDEFGNVITAEDGDSMSNGLLLNGVGLSAGREPNQNTEELVKRWNAYDANQQEIACLKNQVSQLKSEHESMAAYAEQRNNLLKMMNNNMQSIKADAIDDAAKWLSPETPAGEEGCELLRQYANEIREGKS